MAPEQFTELVCNDNINLNVYYILYSTVHKMLRNMYYIYCTYVHVHIVQTLVFFYDSNPSSGPVILMQMLSILWIIRTCKKLRAINDTAESQMI